MDETMATRNDVTANKSAPVAQPVATVKTSIAPKMPATQPTKKLAPPMPKTAANNNAATGTRHWIVGRAVAEFVAQNGPLSFVDGDVKSWDKLWDDIGTVCDDALSRAGMPGLSGAHQLKCYIPGFVAQSDVAALYGAGVKRWEKLPAKWLDLVKSGLVDSGTFTDILTRMPLAKLTDDLYDRLVKLNGDKNAVRSLLHNL